MECTPSEGMVGSRRTRRLPNWLAPCRFSWRICVMMVMLLPAGVVLDMLTANEPLACAGKKFRLSMDTLKEANMLPVGGSHSLVLKYPGGGMGLTKLLTVKSRR